MAFELVRPYTFPIQIVDDVATLKAIATGGLTQGDQRYVQEDGVFVKWQSDCQLSEDQSRGIIIPNSSPASGRWLYFEKDSVAASQVGTPGATQGVQTGPFGPSAWFAMPSVNNPIRAIKIFIASDITIGFLSVDIISDPGGTKTMGLGIYNESGTQLARTAAFSPTVGLLTQAITQSPAGAISSIKLTANTFYYFAVGWDQGGDQAINMSGFTTSDRNNITPHKCFQENNAAVNGILANSITPSSNVQTDGPWIAGTI